MDNLTKGFVIAASSVVVLAGGAFLMNWFSMNSFCVKELAERVQAQDFDSLGANEPTATDMASTCASLGNDPKKAWASIWPF
jgi:hypothetical protein